MQARCTIVAHWLVLLAMPAFLHINPWKREPDTRAGEKPEQLEGTLTVTGLKVGSSYEIYRWDSVQPAFEDYGDRYRRTSFTATKDAHVYVDDKPFLSNGTTYYRAVKAAAV